MPNERCTCGGQPIRGNHEDAPERLNHLTDGQRRGAQTPQQQGVEKSPATPRKQGNGQGKCQAQQFCREVTPNSRRLGPGRGNAAGPDVEQPQQQPRPNNLGREVRACRPQQTKLWNRPPHPVTRTYARTALTSTATMEMAMGVGA